MNTTPRFVDVLIIGAGLSAVTAASTLRAMHPDLGFLMVESRERSGGTWDLFRYPGVRSDTDPFTMGLEQRPWPGQGSVASGEEFREYLADTANEFALADHILNGWTAVAASWDSGDALWSVTFAATSAGTTSDTASGQTEKTMTARWLVAATGYYDYANPHRPDLMGQDEFEGLIIHPQQWPEDLDVAGRNVVLLGSGATAVTLLPQLVARGANVTMVQRTPTYILPWPSRDVLGQVLPRILGHQRAAAWLRTIHAAGQQVLWQVSRRTPRLAKRVLRTLNRHFLPADVSVAQHFTPPYEPWDQRICIAPDGDFFRALHSPLGHIRTNSVDHLDSRHVVLSSGERLPTDVLITATGFELQLFGGMELSVDGHPVNPASRVTYRGAMLTGVPNFLWLMGYANASWTLKINLTSQWFCSLLAHMRAVGARSVFPVAPPHMRTRPALELSAGYVRRGQHLLPRQGPVAPWQMGTSWFADRRYLRRTPVIDSHLRFDTPAPHNDDAAPSHDCAPAPATFLHPRKVLNPKPWHPRPVHKPTLKLPGEEVASSPLLVPTDRGREQKVTLDGKRFLCVREDGPPDGPAVLLITGLAFDLTTWPYSFVQGLVDQGRRVIRVDNRDVGRSFRWHAPAPTPGQLLREALPREQYTVEDMSQDLADLMDALELERVDVIGFSLGGMIAQSLAAHHPDRVRSLVSLCSTTGDPSVGTTAWSTAAMLMLPGAKNRDMYVRGRLVMSRHLAGPAYPADVAYETLLARTHWDRSLDPRGEHAAMHRQIGAIRASGNRAATLRHITAPTLVIHGTHDKIVRPDGGAATAATIPGARSVTVEGMGHQIHPLVVPRLLALITGHVA